MSEENLICEICHTQHSLETEYWECQRMHREERVAAREKEERQKK